MKNFVRRIAVVIGATAISAGLMTVVAPAAQADTSWGWISGSNSPSGRDTSWGW